jgi:hypothetical protein
MKTLILISVVISTSVLGLGAQASEDASCKQKLSGAYTYNNFRTLKEQKGGLPLIRDCKEVHFSRDGASIDSVVYLTDDGQALLIQDNRERKVSLSRIPGQVRDYKVMLGRLIISTLDNKILVVGRDGNVLEMLNAEGESYVAVTGISVDPTTSDLVLKLERQGQEVRLTDEQVTRRLNDSGLYRAISLF